MQQKSEEDNITKLETDRISPDPDSSKSVRPFQIIGEIWMATALGLFFLLRILDSGLFQHLYSRWKAF